MFLFCAVRETFECTLIERDVRERFIAIVVDMTINNDPLVEDRDERFNEFN